METTLMNTVLKRALWAAIVLLGGCVDLPGEYGFIGEEDAESVAADAGVTDLGAADMLGVPVGRLVARRGLDVAQD